MSMFLPYAYDHDAGIHKFPALSQCYHSPFKEATYSSSVPHCRIDR